MIRSDVPRHDRVSLGRTGMEYSVFGSGERTLVILPGLSLSKVSGPAEQLAAIFDCFRKDFTCYLFDRIDDIGISYTTEEMADDTVAAMKALGIGKASVIGYSQGGMMAQVIAIKYPDIVDKIMLGSTASRMNPIMQACMEKWIKYAEAGDMDSLVSDMVKKLYTDQYIDSYDPIEYFKNNAPSPEDVRRFIVMAKAVTGFDVYGRLGEIKAPAIVLGAENDPVLSDGASSEIAEKLGCEVHLFKNYRHAVYDESPDFMRTSFEFLSRKG